MQYPGPWARQQCRAGAAVQWQQGIAAVLRSVVTGTGTRVGAATLCVVRIEFADDVVEEKLAKHSQSHLHHVPSLDPASDRL